MCGLAGFFSKKGIDSQVLLKSSALLRHRGPDDEGFFCLSGNSGVAFRGSDTTGCHQQLPTLPKGRFEAALLHRRLSILELSDRGHQPMVSEEDGVALVFNGEIYNFKELLARHNLDGRQNSNSDTEAVLRLYKKCGTAIFSEFRGMWAMAFYHWRENRLVLSRDRFGIKPLYYSRAPGFFAFSSELKPLLLCEKVQPEVEQKTLLEYLFYGAVADPAATFFRQVEEVEPGCFAEVDLQSEQFRVQRYYTPGAEKPTGTFAELFAQSIQEHLLADVPVGSCLSGGLDSSAITLAAAQSSKTLKTYTCAFPGTEVDESGYARMLAEKLPNLEQHFVTPAAGEFVRNLDTLLNIQELPIGSSSIYAQYRVMQLAAEKGSKVLLDGQGADEVLGGYYNFAGVFLWDLLANGRLPAFYRQYRLLQANFNPAMAKAMARASFYQMPNAVQKLLRRRERLGAGLISAASQPQLKELRAPARGGKSFRELSQNSIAFGLRELLRYEDRNSMAFSIESRVPFLDHRLVDFALNLPAEQKLVNGWTKYPIRHYLQQHQVPVLAWRKDKKGFVTPQQLWRQQTLPALAERLEEMALPDFIDPTAVENLLRSGLRSNEHLSEFWRIFALLRWLHLFNVRVV